MNASISVESEPGRGSTFSFHVPLRRVKDPAKAKRVPDRGTTRTLFNGPILLAEDNPVNQRIALSFGAPGLQRNPSRNGVEAVEWPENRTSQSFLWTARCRKWMALKLRGRFGPAWR